MSIPIGIPLGDGVNVWMGLGSALAMSVAGGWLLASIERRLPRQGNVETIAPTAEKVLPKAA